MHTGTEIYHPGIIQHIDDEKITILIQNVSLCSNCHAQSACTMAETKEKLVEIQHVRKNEFHIAESVFVQCKESIGFQAIWWAYIFPFILILSVMFITFSFTKNELITGLASLGILVPYYFVLYLLKYKFRNKFSFTIHKEKTRWMKS